MSVRRSRTSARRRAACLHSHRPSSARSAAAGGTRDAPHSNEESADVGLVALTTPEVKRVVVYNVTPGGPADLAGIKRLDTILSVDGEDLDRVSYQKFRKMMEGKAGTSVKLVYSHNGGLKRTELKRTLLVNDALEPAKAAG